MRRNVFMGIVATALLGGVAQAEPHEFRLPDGRSIKAEIVGYNAKLGQVELVLANKQRKKINPSIFVEKDQDYIKEWAKLAAFRSPSFFKIECKKDLVEKWKEEETGNITYSDGSVEKETISETKFEKFVYEIRLDNRNDVALEGLSFEYRIFYEQGAAGADQTKLAVSRKAVEGELEIRRLSPKAKTILKTKPVVVHEKDYNGDYNYRGGDPVKESGDIKGIWLRVSAKGADGKKVTRSVYEPSSIEGKYAW